MDKVVDLEFALHQEVNLLRDLLGAELRTPELFTSVDQQFQLVLRMPMPTSWASFLESASSDVNAAEALPKEQLVRLADALAKVKTVLGEIHAEYGHSSTVARSA